MLALHSRDSTMSSKKKTSAKKRATAASRASPSLRSRVIPSSRQDTPDHGWAVELREALARNKKHPSSANRLSIAKTASILRHWELCEKSAQACLTKGGASSDETKECQDLIKVAKEEINREYSYVNNKAYQTEVIPDVMNLELELDMGLMSSNACSFTNLNWLQYSAMVGDIRLLESVVSLGAALDYPVPRDSPHTSSPPMPAPTGSTALMLAVTTKAMYVIMESQTAGFRRAMVPQVLQGVERALQ